MGRSSEGQEPDALQTTNSSHSAHRPEVEDEPQHKVCFDPHIQRCDAVQARVSTGSLLAHAFLAGVGHAHRHVPSLAQDSHQRTVNLAQGAAPQLIQRSTSTTFNEEEAEQANLQDGAATEAAGSAEVDADRKEDPNSNESNQNKEDVGTSAPRSVAETTPAEVRLSCRLHVHASRADITLDQSIVVVLFIVVCPVWLKIYLSVQSTWPKTLFHSLGSINHRR